jgi:hypothetical protein
MNGKRLLRKYNKQEENLDQVIKELNISKEATVTRKGKDKNSTIKKFRTDCKKLYSLLR